MSITVEQIKELRSRTGVGINQVKEALEASNGDMEKAALYLREKGIAKAAKRADKTAENGFVANYIHGDGMIGVLVELNCETDFAARSDAFRALAKDLAIHIAASNPQYLKIEDIPAEILDAEKAIYAKELEGKPENIKEKILEGKLAKFYEEIVLMEQAFVKDDSKKIKDLLNESVASIGEKLQIGRYARIQVGGEAVIGGK